MKRPRKNDLHVVVDVEDAILDHHFPEALHGAGRTASAFRPVDFMRLSRTDCSVAVDARNQHEGGEGGNKTMLHVAWLRRMGG